VEARSSRIVSERDLRAMSNEEFLADLRSCITELDALISAKRRTDREKKPAKHRTAKEALDALPEDDLEEIALHAVTCCNHHMGDFAPWARVRCPFCSEWHKAGDFPLRGDSP